MRRRTIALTALLLACGPQVPIDAEGDDETEGLPPGPMTEGLPTGTESASDSASGGHCDPEPCLDVGVQTPGPPPDVDVGLLDVLLVVDNSSSMAMEQQHLAENFPRIAQNLTELFDHEGQPVDLDLHFMVTSTDVYGGECDSAPLNTHTGGVPVPTSCVERLGDFEPCLDVCPNDVAPDGDFIARREDGSTNLPEVGSVDVNGDGEPDDAVAQALACIGVQGVEGCEFGSPLEAMRTALDPSSEWNVGPDPFLRDTALLMVIVITDHADCSGAVGGADFWETDPATGLPEPTPAMCWYTGASCVGPDAFGVYSSCDAQNVGPIEDVQTYHDALAALGPDKFVLFGLVAGVPEVTQHNEEPPFEPIEGGVYDLQYRNWRDGEWPSGDILPEDHAVGVIAATQQFRFGIGPGCTSEIAQATPPLRLRDVCEGLNEDGVVHCQIESLCDPDFSDVTHSIYVAIPEVCFSETLPDGTKTRCPPIG